VCELNVAGLLATTLQRVNTCTVWAARPIGFVPTNKELREEIMELSFLLKRLIVLQNVVFNLHAKF